MRLVVARRAAAAVAVRSTASTLFHVQSAASIPQQLHEEEEQQKAPSPQDKAAFAEIRALCHAGRLDTAAHILSRLTSPPSDNVYLDLLSACSKQKNLPFAQHIHAHLAAQPGRIDGFLGSILVITLAKCGGPDEASCVLESLPPSRTVFSWTALISGYAELGRRQEALRVYRLMQEDGVRPDPCTFVSLLKACSNTQDFETAKMLHEDARSLGFASDVYVGSILVKIYGKHGSIEEAENVFAALTRHNVVSWSAMLSAYDFQGQAGKALKLFRQMLEVGVDSDQVTISSSLHACATLVDKKKADAAEMNSIKCSCLEIGQALHADACRKDWTSNSYVGNSLVRLYSKCGSILEAENSFIELSQPDVVTWSVLLLGYVKQGQAEKALQLFRQMQEEGVKPDDQVMVGAFQACASLVEKEKELSMGQQLTSMEIAQALHSDAWMKGFTSDVFVSTALVTLYAKGGDIVQSEKVFAGSSEHNIVLWSAMISAYVWQGEAEKALLLYRQMREECHSADQQSFVIAIQACAVLAGKEKPTTANLKPFRRMSLEIGEGLHAEARKKGFSLDGFLINTLVSMYGKCGSIVRAENAFLALSQCDIITYGAMLSTYVEVGQPRKALMFYQQMQKEGVTPNQSAVTTAIQACLALLGKQEVTVEEAPAHRLVILEIGQALHVDAWRKGFISDDFIVNSLITLYGRCGKYVKAESLFKGLCQRSVVSWTTMLSAYVNCRQGWRALRLYRKMQQELEILDNVTLQHVLHACSDTGRLEICRQVHFDITSSGYDVHSSLAKTLIHAYFNLARSADAWAVYNELPEDCRSIECRHCCSLLSGS